MQYTLEQEYELRAFDVDISGCFMPSAILSRMQDIADDHATKVGFGRTFLGNTKGYAWVLTRLYLEMYSYPKLGDSIKMLTYPAPPTKLSFGRFFLIRDDDGKELGKASSIWVLFDINKRCLLRPEALGSPYPHDATLPASPELPTKIIIPTDELEFICTRTVMYSETDMNMHMNNAKYANWVCELFEKDFLVQNKVKSLRINYVSEAKIGQQVDLYTYVRENDTTVYVRGKTEDKTVFDGAVDFFI